jgi:N-acyl-D-amino-acid deacylase
MGVKAGGGGVLEMATDFSFTGPNLAGEIGLYRRVVEASGLPMSLAIAFINERPDLCEALVSEIDAANEAGANIKLQTVGRSICVLMGFDLSLHPFMKCPTYRGLEELKLAERVKRLAEPQVRAAILAEAEQDEFKHGMSQNVGKLYPLGDPPNYEPRASDSVAARAQAAGVKPAAMLYDLMMQNDGKGLLYFPFTNFSTGDFSTFPELIRSENTLLGLGDGGAHVGVICDASQPTFMLSYWGRDRDGERLDLPFLIKSLTSANAEAVGLNDRGRIAVGYKADLNLIDFDRLRLHAPRALYDLPAGGRRLTQDADGYVATFVSGEVTYREGAATGVLPGRLVRGRQSAS